MWESVKHRTAVLLMIVGVCVVTLSFGWRAWRGYRITVLAKNWPTVRAVVVDQSMTDDTNEPRESRDRPTVTAALHYRYAVDGTDYTCVARRTGLASYDGESWLEDYPVGRSCIIHYNVDDPNESVVDVTFRFRTLFDAIVALLAACGFVVLVISVLKGPKPLQKDHVKQG
jgi:hypothetical protein